MKSPKVLIAEQYFNLRSGGLFNIELIGLVTDLR